MYKFASTDIPDFITVKSIVSVSRTIRNGNENSNDGEVHDFWEFLCIKKGEINILVDGEVYHLTPGQLIIYPPHSFHSVAASHEAIINVVCFATDSRAMSDFKRTIIDLNEYQLESLTRLVTLGKHLFTLAPPEVYDRGMIPKESTKDYELQRVSNMLELFLLDLYETESEEVSQSNVLTINNANYRSEQFQKLTDYLKSNLEQNLTLEQISSDCSISIPNLHRLCRKQCGCGPITYFISLKIGVAKKLIRQSSLNFTQISQELGFSTLNYFSKLFKSKTGMTPSEYAKSHYE
ncbi:MAG: helix-turn-helix transcriptional regulator [Oscillospiraceae bacterium]|nr:helix-turn-helix transcriptional regulator [Oscillospiraceae bacterium]